MNLRCWPVRAGTFLAWWLCAIVFAQGQEKQIRLRNERISTVQPDRTQVFRAAQQPGPPVSGLFLIQFIDRFDPAWREVLAAQRVELIRFVPDDAFVARLREVRLEDLRTLPFVQWVGEFRPEHKIHSRVRDALRAPNPAAATEVVVLCAPTAPRAELAEAQSRLEQGHQQSRNRFGSVLRGRLGSGQLQRLAESPSVLWIEPAPRMKLNDEISTKIVAGDGPGHYAYVHQPGFGFTGAGVTVAVADTGLHLGDADEMHPDLYGRTPAFFAYGGLSDASDEHGHGTHVAGIIAGNGALGTLDEQGYLYGLGVAPGASIVTQRIFDEDGNYTFIGSTNTFERLTREAVQAGAVIGNNSWGDDTQGRYDVSAHEFDALVRDAVDDAIMPGDQPYILEFSAGNAGPGPQTIGSPAVAKNVIASGASQNDRLEFFTYADGSEAMADFSSRGPCEDGRIKPDVVAPGTWVASLRSPVGTSIPWLDIDSDYAYLGGTSMSGPQVSGAAAVFVQYYRESFPDAGLPSPALVKAALIHSAVNMDDSVETDRTPNMDEGWGRVDLTQIIRNPYRTQDYLDQTNLLTDGQTYERSVILSSTNEPLKITLVYTDVPGFPGAIPALVNDLDLVVVAPDGRVYRGNQFARGQSVPDATSSDNINNVEGIYISAPQPGEYLVRVRAGNVVQDARRDTPGIDDQDFALVASGDINLSLEAGIVLLDRSSYTAPGQIRIKLFDLDLAGESSATVTVRSAVEPSGQPVVLRPVAANSISFTGAIDTATGPPAADGKLQITNGAWIRVEYFDAGEGTTNVADAVADLLAPIITNVSVTNQFGQTLVRWTTQEPADSVVRFNTNTLLSRAVTNNLRTSLHEMELRNLVAGQTYYFVVISMDAAGNSATNNNGGAPYTFVAPEAATVLLVDAYVPTEFDETLIPLSTYTGPLDQIGVSYDIWSAESEGMPAYGDLSPYRVVIWRVNDSFWSDDTIPLPQQTALQQYLNNGGAFFMSSMQILSRLLGPGGPSPGAAFVTNVLHVRRFDRGDPFCVCHCEDCDEDFRVPMAVGVDGDVIGDGFAATLDYSAYPGFEDSDYGPNFGDTFGVATNAAPIVFEQVSRKACGMRYPRTGQDSTGRVAFVSFPLDSIPISGPSPNNRTEFLRRALQFLSPGLNGLGSIAFSQAAYKLPDQLTIEVGDSDLAGSTGAVVQVSSTTQSTPITITLTETPQRGLFRGFLPLVSTPASNKLQAAHGDTLLAQYNDASGQGTIQALATVDATPASITNLKAEPKYQDAVVYWHTLEPTDALVQFGESAFLGRTAYVSDLGTNHAVQITGLAPDRTYYYKVVGRDAAGNATEDPPNNGLLHTFRTLPPRIPPFIDNLQTGGTDWSVFNGENTQYGWEVGSPNNGHVTFTPSGDATVWASNLGGSPANTIDTSLISPAIDLSGGNVARLKFWHAYDFRKRTDLDLREVGKLYIVNNSLSAPLTLATYLDATPGTNPWQLAEFDLTPYLGSVIFLVWHHQLKARDADYRPGWALDDICVTVSNMPPGRITVSNNLAQARVTLGGPVNRTGQGYWNDFTNLPPGRYTITWQSVPYYQTPAPQTVDLATDDLIERAGNYTFPDTNGNDISDTWEQQFFGSLQPVRTCQTDTDGDGFSDCAEFIAGTNPTNAVSHLRVFAPTTFFQAGSPKLRFQWTSTPGRIYQLQALRRDESGIWDGQSIWIQATSGTTSTNISAPDQYEPNIFRIEVRP